MNWQIFWAAIVIFAAASFFFALAESALFSLGKWRVEQLVETSPVAGKRVSNLLARPQELLATIVLGNTLANSGIVGFTLWMIFLRNWSVPVTILLLFAFILFGCEVLPKTLAVRAPEFWAVRLARPMKFFTLVAGPLTRIAQSLNNGLLKKLTPRSLKPQQAPTEKEYQELLEMAVQQGALRNSEKEIILEIVSLDQKTAVDVMKPRTTMSAIPDDLTREDMVEAARKARHTRLPMYDETPDTIVGVLNVRAFLLDQNVELEEVIEFPSFVPASMNLLQLLKSLQRQRRGLAIVLDEYGGTAGLVTTEDILEQMLGEFRSVRERTRFTYEKLERDKWRVNGACSVDDFRRDCPEIGPVDDVDTMGGLLVRTMEVVPAAGQSAVYKGLKLTASKVDDRRVRELLVERVRK